MKLEFLPDGSPDCPLIRLYSFSRAETLRLKQIADQLSSGTLRQVALHEEAGVEPINRIQLFLEVGNRDQGIVQNTPESFNCILSVRGWLEVSFLLQPFCQSETNGFQWLVDKGPISLLISKKGTW